LSTCNLLSKFQLGSTSLMWFIKNWLIHILLLKLLKGRCICVVIYTVWGICWCFCLMGSFKWLNLKEWSTNSVELGVINLLSRKMYSKYLTMLGKWFNLNQIRGLALRGFFNFSISWRKANNKLVITLQIKIHLLKVKVISF